MNSNLYVLIIPFQESADAKLGVSRKGLFICEKPPIHWVLSSIEGLNPQGIFLIGGEESCHFKKYEWNGCRFLPGVSEKIGIMLQTFLDKVPGDDSLCLLMPENMPGVGQEILSETINRFRSQCILIPSYNKKVVHFLSKKDDRKDFYPAKNGILLVHAGSLKRLVSVGPVRFDSFRDLIKLCVSEFDVDFVFPMEEKKAIYIEENSDVAVLESFIGRSIIKSWMKRGIRVHDPDLVYIGPDVVLEAGVEIYQNVVLRGKTEIGRGSILLPGSFIENSIIERNVRVEYSVIRDSKVKRGTTVGPFAHIRGGALIGPENRIGNFVEVKKSTTGKRTKSAHLAYIGDATVGDGVNIGAGTITCNFDGEKKNPTIIEDDAFVGSDVILVAPVKIGKGAYIGAGSTITKNVPGKSLSVARARQKNIEGWVKRRKKNNK